MVLFVAKISKVKHIRENHPKPFHLDIAMMIPPPSYITKGEGARGLYPLEDWKIGKTTPPKIPPMGSKPPYRKKFRGGCSLPQKFSALFWPIPPRKKACGGVVSTPENSKILPYHPTGKNFGGVVSTPLPLGDFGDVWLHLPSSTQFFGPEVT